MRIFAMYSWVCFISSVIYLHHVHMKRSFLLCDMELLFLTSDRYMKKKVFASLEQEITTYLAVFQYSRFLPIPILTGCFLYSLDSLTKWPMARSNDWLIWFFYTWCKFIITLIFVFNQNQKIISHIVTDIHIHGLI